MELFNTGNSDIIHLLMDTFFVKSSPDLSTTQDKSSNFFSGFNLEPIFLVCGISEDTMEVTIFTEILERRFRERMTQKCFREEQDQWFSEFTVNLTTEDMEDVGGGSTVDDLHVAILVLTVEFVL